MARAFLRPCLDCKVRLVEWGRCSTCRGKRQQAQDAARGTAHERYGPNHRPLRRQVLEEETHCGICKEPGLKDDVMDHKVPVSAGGKTERDNVQRAHYACNAKKAAREGFLKRRRGRR